MPILKEVRDENISGLCKTSPLLSHLSYFTQGPVCLDGNLIHTNSRLDGLQLVGLL